MDSRRKSQNDKVLEFIQQHDGITSMDAFTKLGVTRLSGRIYDLQKRGYLFDKTTIDVPTRGGGKAKVTLYQLAGEENL